MLAREIVVAPLLFSSRKLRSQPTEVLHCSISRQDRDTKTPRRSVDIGLLMKLRDTGSPVQHNIMPCPTTTTPKKSVFIRRFEVIGVGGCRGNECTPELRCFIFVSTTCRSSVVVPKSNPFRDIMVGRSGSDTWRMPTNLLSFYTTFGLKCTYVQYHERTDHRPEKKTKKKKHKSQGWFVDVLKSLLLSTILDCCSDCSGK